MRIKSYVARGCSYIVRMLFAAARLGRRRSRVMTALAFVIASLSLAGPAQAWQVTTFAVNVLNPAIVICTNRSHTYRVQILTTSPPEPGESSEPEVGLIEPGTTISVTDNNPSLGRFTSSTFEVRPLPGSNFARPDTALFTYTAGEKAGKTTFVFGADDLGARPFELNVTVQPCRFQVVAKSRFFATYAGGSTLTAVALAKSDANGLAADESGVYKGEANVTWLAVARIPNCGYQSMIAAGKVKLDGFLVDVQNLNVRLNYLPAAFVEVISCASLGPAGSAGNVEATSLDITVPISGGTATVEQNITKPNLAPGKASVWVTPIRGSAGR